MIYENLSAGENKISLTGEAGHIEAILHLPSDDIDDNKIQAMLVCCHPHPLFSGAMSNKIVHTICKTFCSMGLPALRFNFRGVGGSEGAHDKGVGESKDLLIVSQLMSETWPDRQLWLAGFSFGSWVAANSAVAAGAKQLLSIAPPVQHFNFENLNKPECPWLILMGEDDDVVEPQEVFDWVDSQEKKPELIRFPETGHFFHGKIVKMRKLLEQHYKQILMES